ncbi:unnamed protein product, partial [marine sediment metagenome]
SEGENGGNRISAVAHFYIDCDFGTRIETSSTFSDGSPKYLSCEWGEALTISVQWGENSVPTWIEDFGGFSIYENFYDWDFTPLIKYLTLSKAERK